MVISSMVDVVADFMFFVYFLGHSKKGRESGEERLTVV